MQISRTFIVIAIAVILAFVVVTGSFFTVSETEQAIVLQFGAVKRIDRTAGLKFKIPLIQDVSFFEKRLLDLESPSQGVTRKKRKKQQHSSISKAAAGAAAA